MTTRIAVRAGMLWLGVAAIVAGQPADRSGSWSPKAAAQYLDARLDWWSTWATAARDHQTFCISCHTAAPYAMARAELRADLGEKETSPGEQKLLANVVKRVRLWKDVEPFYPDEKRGKPKTAESRGTESIFNALILAGYDARKGELSADAKLAFDNMWAEQIQSGEAAGAWQWLQFHNAPWEGDSQYYGATLAAIAIGTAPEGFLSGSKVEPLNALRAYLKKNADAQALANRLMLVWAAATLPGLLTEQQTQAILQEAIAKQNADGGFSLSSMVGGWKRADGTALESASDGYATGLVALTLEKSHPGDRAALGRALAWLKQNQQADGRWLAWSLNKNRDLSSDIGKFMSDAATSYAILALQSAGPPPRVSDR